MPDKKETENISNESFIAVVVILAFIAWCLVPPSKNTDNKGIKWFLYLAMLACASGMVYFTFFAD